MEELRKNLSKINVPCGNAVIYKDECVYSYDNAETPTGLYVSLTSFLGFGEAYVREYARKSGNNVFLHIKREKTIKEGESDAEKEEAGKEAEPERKITRLAIGVEGGYNETDMAKKYEIKDTYSIVVAPAIDKKIPFPDQDLPMRVTQSVEAILAADSAIAKLEKATLTGTWDGEVRQTSKYAENLQQLGNGKKIPPSGWKCEKCDLTNNLWLNLTDGSILCGRKFFDGSGGNDHAIEHYRETNYPLAVKLGTITAEGKSDVFSYPEDDMVLDPYLEKHLAHFGINMAAMKKSEKSMVELELEINQRIGEWSVLTESDSELQPLAGPGYTGMRNLGNSCYINSVMQVLFVIPDFQKRFVGNGAETYFNEFPNDPANDFNIQMAKLGNGLQSGKYSSIAENTLDSELTGISPAMFKSIVGKNHPDFSTKQQQDANDFYLHLLMLLDRNSRNQFNPGDALKFQLEDRVECMSSRKVKYKTREESSLRLTIPLEKATNLDEVKEYQDRVQAAQSRGQRPVDRDIVRHKVPLQACLERFFGNELIEQFYSTAINGKTNAKKSTRLATMPDFLMIHLAKFTLGDDWVPKKLDVSVDMPDELDLCTWRSTGGLQPGEEPLPEPPAEQPKFDFDENVLSELLNMGYPQEACKRACFHTRNIGLEAASNWLMEHIADPDISDPFVVPNNQSIGDGAADCFVANPESLAMLMSMGFDELQAVTALKATDGNVERATDWIFSHADSIVETAPTVADTTASSEPATTNYRDGIGRYKLVAFISHMGTSAQVGHYVCHIRKKGEWVIFNDSKVAKSQNPPKDLGYLYLYMRDE
ncbi:ubiquitin carboxyl-terminal hydrolase 5 [Scaptodrosophila lebanonensis]|uniref:Ubiquitin carboxyl-terminal hydrolase n=1 Tax=Drosophila lebanonensis TaxID=7225 RepID=A0A6J2UDB5_DROLE|nr:ubiquitin carboxyl-terminal hydrolase 5 [Scaptodrosophila lebanonensis]